MHYTRIAPFGPRDDESLYDTDRRGFIVIGPHPGSKLLAYEGFSLGSQDGERLVEYDLVELTKIDTPADLSGAGVGRALMRTAAEEARRRGYDRLRLNIHNARVVSNLEKLVEEGALRGVEHFRGPSVNEIPSDWLPALSDRLTHDESRNYINQDPTQMSNGFSHEHYISSLVEL